MPSSKTTTQKKPLVKSGPNYTDQTDTVYDFALKRTQGTPGDWLILAFCGWNLVVVGAVLGQYVADMFLYCWFLAITVAINIAITTAFGSKVLWGQFMKATLAHSKSKIALVAAVFVGALLSTWGIWILVATYQDWSVIGHYSAPFPYMTKNWQVGLYWTGLTLAIIMWSVVESLWWHIGWDGLSGGFFPLRLWGSLCMGMTFWCISDPIHKGVWSWLWFLIAFLLGWLGTLASFFVADLCGILGAIGWRMGFWFGWFLIWSHLKWQWWGLSAWNHQYGWAAGNLFNLGNQTPPTP